VPIGPAFERGLDQLDGKAAGPQVSAHPQRTLTPLGMVGDVVTRKTRIIEHMLVDELGQRRLDDGALEAATLEPRAQLGAGEIAAREERDGRGVCRRQITSRTRLE